MWVTHKAKTILKCRRFGKAEAIIVKHGMSMHSLENMGKSKANLPGQTKGSIKTENTHNIKVIAMRLIQNDCKSSAVGNRTKTVKKRRNCNSKQEFGTGKACCDIFDTLYFAF